MMNFAIGIIAIKNRKNDQYKKNKPLYMKNLKNEIFISNLNLAIKTLLADMLEAEISQNAQNLHASAQNGVLPNNLSTETKYPRNF